MIKKILFISSLLILLSTLTGCWDNIIIEENTIATSVAIDTQGKSNHQFTFVTVESFNNGDKGDFITVEADILSQALVKANNRVSRPLRSAKINTMIFSQAAAEQGYIPLADTHKIEEVNRFLPDYLVAENSAAEIYKTLAAKELKDKSLTYITDLVTAAAQSGYCPDISSYDYNLNFLSGGPDPMLPLLSIKDEDIYVKGTALFSEEKMTGSLNATESVFLQLLHNKNTAFYYYIVFPLEETSFDDCIFQTKRCNTSIAVRTIEDELYIDINLDIKGSFDRFVWAHLRKLFSREEIISYVADYFNKNTKETFTILQSCYSDPCNIKGKLKMTDFSFYNTHDFYRVYNKAKVTVTTDLNILNAPNPDISDGAGQ